MLIIITIEIMIVEYICQASLNVMQIKISFAVAVNSITGYVQYVPRPVPPRPAVLVPFPAPARAVDFWPCPSPPPPLKKKASPTIPDNYDQKLEQKNHPQSIHGNLSNYSSESELKS